MQASFLHNTKKVILLIVLAITVNSYAQKPHFKDKKVSKEVLNHISALASDSMQGRYTATAGERMAAEYIAKEFEAIGLAPAGRQEYYQPMIVPNMRMAKQNTSLILGDDTMALFTDFYPISLSTNRGQYKGETINIGYGISDDGLKHNDYKDKELQGKAVMINIGIPGGSNPHNRFIGWEDLEYRVEYAKSKGAVAVVLYASDSTKAPSGTLVKTVENSAIPVVYTNKNLSTITSAVSEIVVDILFLSTNGHNVLGYIDHGAQNTVIVGAHHDHMGKGRKGGSWEENPMEVHNGADDNASGVAGLFILAREIKRKPRKYKNNNYLFIAFTGQEQGQLGSKHFITSDLYPKYDVNYMVNLDMIGHLDTSNKTLLINGVGTSPTWNKAIAKTKICKRKIAKIKTTESGIGPSDHMSFYVNGIPAVHFSTGHHQHYHTSTDDVSIINAGGEAFALRYIWKLMRTLDQQGKVAYSKTKDGNTLLDLKVTLGIVLDEVYEGVGLRVAGVHNDKKGKKVGLLSGDVILSVGPHKIQNLQDYIDALNIFKPSDKTTLTIKRGTETKLLNVQF